MLHFLVPPLTLHIFRSLSNVYPQHHMIIRRITTFSQGKNWARKAETIWNQYNILSHIKKLIHLFPLFVDLFNLTLNLFLGKQVEN